MPLYGILSDLIGTHPFPGIFITLSLVGVMAFLMVNLNTDLIFLNERTFLPAVVYILLSGFFPQYQMLNPAIIGAMFLILAIKRIMEAYRNQGVAYNFFDAGLLISTGSLFYANLIWFGLLVFIGISLLRAGDIREIAISFIGLVTPYVMTFGIYYVLGKDLNNLISLLEYNLFGKSTSYAFTGLTIAAVTTVGLITLVSVVYLLMSLNTKKIRTRKTFIMFFWIFIISLSILFLVPAVSMEIFWITSIPVSYFLSHYFVLVKKRLVPEIYFSAIVIMILLIQVWYII